MKASAGRVAQRAISLDCVGRLDLFREMPADALSDILALARLDHTPKGTLVFEQGGQADQAYALNSGRVRIVQTGSDGGQAIVRFIGPGEMFGTLAMFTDRRYPADAIAVETSSVLSWSKPALSSLIVRYPAIALNVIGVLGVRMAQLQDRFRELMTQCASQRIAKAILQLAAQSGRTAPRGTAIVLHIGLRDLADYAGTTIHTASRTLTAWKKAGFLASGVPLIFVRDLHAIRQLAGLNLDP